MAPTAAWHRKALAAPKKPCPGDKGLDWPW